MTSPLRFGVIGANRGRSFMRICNEAGGATVTALYDTDPARAQLADAEFGAQAFDDWETFLAAPIDAVVVASPLPFHTAQAVAALQAGKHVLSEVTACLRLDDARALVAAQRESRAVYMLAENYRYLDGSLSWRGRGAIGVYGTHSLGPLLYIMDDRVVQVSALAVAGGAPLAVPDPHEW